MVATELVIADALSEHVQTEGAIPANAAGPHATPNPSNVCEDRQRRSGLAGLGRPGITAAAAHGANLPTLAPPRSLP